MVATRPGNPKSEYRNPKQIQMTKPPNPNQKLGGNGDQSGNTLVSGLGILNFDIVSDFVRRIWDFSLGSFAVE
jgi:hypothetical protein